MSFQPVTFYKNGTIEVASTSAEYVQYLFDGWRLGGPAPVLPRSLIHAYLADLDALETELRAAIGTGSGGTGGGTTVVKDITLDIDGVPYLTGNAGVTVGSEIAFDTDGVPYFVGV